jgi:REP element-mobilizing transposase RayT
MAHTYCHLFTHVIFSTKGRRKTIRTEWKDRLLKYFVGIGRKSAFRVDSCNGTDDHMHLLLCLPADMPLSKAMQYLKGSSSKWINEEFGRFTWQQGYGALTVSPSQVSAVRRYIEDQERHHKKMDSRAEFIAFLEKGGVAIDVRYIE